MIIEVFLLSTKYGIIIRTGITYEKISCYMYASGCRWLIVENVKIFILDIFEFPYAKEIVKS